MFEFFGILLILLATFVFVFIPLKALQSLGPIPPLPEDCGRAHCAIHPNNPNNPNNN